MSLHEKVRVVESVQGSGTPVTLYFNGWSVTGLVEAFNRGSSTIQVDGSKYSLRVPRRVGIATN
jgi:hypothetical protein